MLAGLERVCCTGHVLHFLLARQQLPISRNARAVPGITGLDFLKQARLEVAAHEVRGVHELAQFFPSAGRFQR